MRNYSTTASWSSLFRLTTIPDCNALFLNRHIGSAVAKASPVIPCRRLTLTKRLTITIVTTIEIQTKGSIFELQGYLTPQSPLPSAVQFFYICGVLLHFMFAKERHLRLIWIYVPVTDANTNEGDIGMNVLEPWMTTTWTSWNQPSFLTALRCWGIPTSLDTIDSRTGVICLARTVSLYEDEVQPQALFSLMRCWEPWMDGSLTVD